MSEEIETLRGLLRAARLPELEVWEPASPAARTAWDNVVVVKVRGSNVLPVFAVPTVAWRFDVSDPCAESKAAQRARADLVAAALPALPSLLAAADDARRMREALEEIAAQECDSVHLSKCFSEMDPRTCREQNPAKATGEDDLVWCGSCLARAALGKETP